MGSVKRYSKAIQPLSWTNLGIISLTISFSLVIMKINSQNTDSFPVLFLLDEIFDYIRREFFFFYSFIQFILDSQIFKLEVQITIVLSSRGS